jgi:hypothetical protein
MTREQLIPLIQEAVIAYPNANPFDFRLCEFKTIEYFAKLVAEAEREACAEVCDSFKFSPAADAIRARGKA